MAFVKQALQYIEIDLDYCSLDFGVYPCPALGTPPAVAFGNAPYLTRDGGLTGAAQSKSMTFSCWIRPRNQGGRIVAAVETLGGGTGATRMIIDTTSTRFRAVGNATDGAGGALILLAQSSPLNIVDGHLYHIMFSVDLSDPDKCHLYVDDVSDLEVITYTNDDMDFVELDWGIGGYPNGTALLDGDLAEVWFAPAVYIDLSIEANRRKFITAAGHPADLGADGSIPMGTQPLIYMSGTLDDWATNKGIGGGFTTHGTLAPGAGLFGAGNKCFQSIATCPVRDSFVNVPVTLRFAIPTSFLPPEIECVPSISSIDLDPATLSLGENLGERASLTVTFTDHKDSDTGPGGDKYLADRDYNPWEQGTYWGKFRARHPFQRGRPLRWITGFVGDTLAEMTTRHFVIDSITGPTLNGMFKIVAKDVLKQLDGDRAIAPRPNSGALAANITDVQTSAGLIPSGVGAEYPASGYLNIGGTEIVAFTRSGDSLTIGRGFLGTPASAHNAQDLVQWVLVYSSQDPANIIEDLMVNYAGVPVGYIPMSEWLEETGTFLSTLYTAIIPIPTSVRTLVSELLQQAALATWWRDAEQTIGLQVLRGIETSAAIFSPTNVIAESLQIEDQPDKRISKVLHYFAQINPLTGLTDPANYRSLAILDDEEAEVDYGTAAIKTIYSRWIPAGGRAVANRANTLMLARYRDPPRRFNFSVMRDADAVMPALAQGFGLQGWPLQDETGALATIPIEVTRVNAGPDVVSVEAEEMLFTGSETIDADTRYVIYDFSNNHVNLRASHDLLYPPPVSGDVVYCTVLIGVNIGSSYTSIPAFDTGDWPAGVAWRSGCGWSVSKRMGFLRRSRRHSVEGPRTD
jgi:hypothetical protein